jgi:hypothetical protein
MVRYRPPVLDGTLAGANAARRRRFVGWSVAFRNRDPDLDQAAAFR